MDRPDDHYRTLQVHPAAEPEVIEAAYRALARKHHPDRNPSPSAPAEMARLNHAFAVLRSPTARAVYDADLTRQRPHLVITPPPASYQPDPRRTALQHSESGRGVSLIVLFPLFLLAGAGLVLLVLFGPLGSSEISSTGDSNRTAATTPTRRLDGADRTGIPVTPTPTSAPSVEALRNSLLRSQKETAVEERGADVTGDGVAELLVLAQPASCSARCKRSLIVIARSHQYWRISDLDERSLVTISLEPPGIEIFQDLKLTGEDPCCPTTGRATFHRWTGKDFAVNGVYFEALGTNELSPEEAVRRFYESITSNGLIRSYAMFSRPYQDRHPYESWSAGFATTGSIKVNKIEQTGPGVVAGDVTATRAGAGSSPERYTGTWRLVETRFGWRLDEGSIELVP